LSWQYPLTQFYVHCNLLIRRITQKVFVLIVSVLVAVSYLMALVQDTSGQTAA